MSTANATTFNVAISSITVFPQAVKGVETSYIQGKMNRMAQVVIDHPAKLAAIQKLPVAFEVLYYGEVVASTMPEDAVVTPWFDTTNREEDELLEGYNPTGKPADTTEYEPSEWRVSVNIYLPSEQRWVYFGGLSPYGKYEALNTHKISKLVELMQAGKQFTAKYVPSKELADKLNTNSNIL